MGGSETKSNIRHPHACSAGDINRYIYLRASLQSRTLYIVHDQLDLPVPWKPWGGGRKSRHSNKAKCALLPAANPAVGTDAVISISVNEDQNIERKEANVLGQFQS